MEWAEADVEVFVKWVSRVVMPSVYVRPDTSDAHLTAHAESAAVAARVLFDAAARPPDDDIARVIFDLLCCEREDLWVA